MAKLNPPVIEGVVPAFYGSTIEVPFSMNQTVGENSYAGFSLKIKTVQSNYYLGEISCSGKDAIFVLDTNITQKLNVGQYYKIQIAYIDKTGLIGYYSTVATIKYTTKPSISVLDSTDGFTYTGLYSQEDGDITEKIYSYQFDLKDNKGRIIETSGECLHNSSFDTENYQSTDSFTITYDLESNITYYLTYKVKTINGLEESSLAKRLHKTDSIDSNLKTDLKVELNYEDGYVDIRLQKPEDVEVEESAVGSFILLRADSETNFKVWNEVLKFVLYGQQPSRHLWKDMTVKQGVSYKYAIQQYNSYNLRSNKIESDIVKVDFEYAYLFDGERQLKIKYNPKVSSFKNTVLESKVDTIGSQYPFIFRNGNVKYKEFPVSGLISLLSDENNLFYEIDEDPIFKEVRNYDIQYHKITTIKDEETFLKYLSRFYIYQEEKDEYISLLLLFNKELEEFFQKQIIYKYERSKYIEIDKTNMYLKDFNQNASQLFIKQNNKYKALSSYIKETENSYYKKYSSDIYDKIAVPSNSRELNDNSFSRNTNLTSVNIKQERNFKLEALEWLTNGQPKLFRSPTEGNYLVRLLNVSLSPNDTLGRMLHTFNATAYEVDECSYEALTKADIVKTDDTTTQQLRIQSVDLSSKSIAQGENLLSHTASSVRLEGLAPGEKIRFVIDGETHEIMIGITGSYLIELQDDISITSLSFISGPQQEMTHQGILTYAYYTSDFRDSFDTINTITITPVPARQFLSTDKEIISQLTDRKTELQSIGQIKLTLRDDGDLDLYYWEPEKGESYYSTDSEGQKVFELEPHASSSIYKVYQMQIIDGKEQKTLVHYLDGYSLEQLSLEDMEGHECTSAWINNEQIDLYDIYTYTVRIPSNIETLTIGKAVICDLTYQSKIISYDVEKTSDEVMAVKTEYDKACNKLNSLITASNATLTQIVAQEELCKQLYKEYVAQVDAAIIEAERR